MRVISILVVLTLLMGCAKKSVPAGDDRLFHEDGFECTQNETDSYQLCVRTNTGSKTAGMATEYFIADTTGTKLFTGSFSNGYVKWLDHNAVEVYETPGMISTELSKEDVAKVYLIDLDSLITKKAYLINNKSY